MRKYKIKLTKIISLFILLLAVVSILSYKSSDLPQINEADSKVEETQNIDPQADLNNEQNDEEETKVSFGSYISSPSSYKVTFNLVYDNIVINKEDYLTKTVQPNSTIDSIETPILNTSLASFEGWYLDPSYIQEFKISSPINSNINIYAKYDISSIDDFDGDGLSNKVEITIGTNPEKYDTDDDGLNDLLEILLDLNPLLVDTDNNGVLDIDEDTDKDGLTNREEILLNISPHLLDTDNDGINDYDEVYTYLTNPLKIDTDEDGANDLWEIENGYDPNVFDLSFLIDIKPEEPTNRTPVTAGIKTTQDGDKLSSLTIKKVQSLSSLALPFSIKGSLGDVYDYSMEGEVGEATLVFYYDICLDTCDDNFAPVIAYFNEETQDIEILTDEYTWDRENGIVTVKTTHFSKYVLVNLFERAKSLVNKVVDFLKDVFTNEKDKKDSTKNKIQEKLGPDTDKRIEENRDRVEKSIQENNNRISLDLSPIDIDMSTLDNNSLSKDEELSFYIDKPIDINNDRHNTFFIFDCNSLFNSTYTYNTVLSSIKTYLSVIKKENESQLLNDKLGFYYFGSYVETEKEYTGNMYCAGHSHRTSCSHCSNGKIYDTCSTCSGTGYITCPSCKGSGYGSSSSQGAYACTTCGGYGNTSTEGFIRGLGKVSCSCNNGKLSSYSTCSYCDGNGNIYTTTYCDGCEEEYILKYTKYPFSNDTDIKDLCLLDYYDKNGSISAGIDKLLTKIDLSNDTTINILSFSNISLDESKLNTLKDKSIGLNIFNLTNSSISNDISSIKSKIGYGGNIIKVKDRLLGKSLCKVLPLIGIDTNKDGIVDKVSNLIKEGKIESPIYPNILYNIDLISADIDNDGLLNGEEVKLILTSDDNFSLKILSSPLLIDSDGDGITDLEEIDKYMTDPIRVDIDNEKINKISQDIDLEFKDKVNILTSTVIKDRESVYLKSILNNIYEENSQYISDLEFSYIKEYLFNILRMVQNNRSNLLGTRNADINRFVSSINDFNYLSFDEETNLMDYFFKAIEDYENIKVSYQSKDVSLYDYLIENIKIDLHSNIYNIIGKDIDVLIDKSINIRELISYYAIFMGTVKEYDLNISLLKEVESALNESILLIGSNMYEKATNALIKNIENNLKTSLNKYIQNISPSGTLNVSIDVLKDLAINNLYIKAIESEYKKYVNMNNYDTYEKRKLNKTVSSLLAKGTLNYLEGEIKTISDKTKVNDLLSRANIFNSLSKFDFMVEHKELPAIILDNLVGDVFYTTNNLLANSHYLNNTKNLKNLLVDEKDVFSTDYFLVAKLNATTKEDVLVINASLNQDFISNQHGDFIGKLIISQGNVDNNGCGIIAIYNSLIYKNIIKCKKEINIIEFANIIESFERSNNTILLGKFGVNPYAIAPYIKTRGLNIDFYDGTSTEYSFRERVENLKYNEAAILQYVWYDKESDDSNKILDEGAHYITIIRDANGELKSLNENNAELFEWDKVVIQNKDEFIDKLSKWVKQSTEYMNGWIVY